MTVVFSVGFLVVLAVVVNVTIIIVELAKPNLVTDWHVAVGMPLSWRPTMLTARIAGMAVMVIGLFTLPVVCFCGALVLFLAWTPWSSRHWAVLKFRRFWVAAVGGAPAILVMGALLPAIWPR